MPYRLMLFDLDGTLLSKQREILARNLTALHQVMSKGVLVGLATGRTLRSVQPYIEALQPNGPLILFNGARVWDTPTKTCVYERSLSHQHAIDALLLARDIEDCHINLYVGDEIYISRRTPRSIESEIKDGVPHTLVGDLAEWLSRQKSDPVKVMLIADPEKLEKFSATYSEMRRPSTLIRSEWNYLEIMSENVTKGHALDVIEQKYRIPCADIISFGDNLNDVTMTQRCGMGVAMGNAHPELITLAKRVIGHHDTDAIADFITEVFP